MTEPMANPVEVSPEELGQRLAQVRLVPATDAVMEASLRRYGQLSQVVAFRDDHYQIILLQIYLANNLVKIANSLSVGSNNFLLGTASATTNGYSYLPNGLIFQWGQLATLNTTAQFITFPIAFPTSMFSVSGTANGAAFEVTTSNTTGITAISGQATNRLGYWMAIGN